NKDHYLIKWGEPHARIEGDIRGKETCKEIVAFLECGDNKTCVFPKNPMKIMKQINVNGVKTKALDLIGEFVTVLFTPEDINLISASPQMRRRYLDM
ncbi:unnamed protein product, partial [marine sediment metagenome]